MAHTATNDAATWKDALAGVSTPEHYSLTKTLVYKPKGAKNEKAILVMAVALNETSLSAGQVAKVVGASDARFATPDAIKEALGVTVEQRILPLSPTG